MIKRPGNEDYLAKVMEDERKAYLKMIEVVDRPLHMSESTDSDDGDEGLLMMGHGGSNEH